MDRFLDSYMSFTRQMTRSLALPRREYESQACYNSFCHHWQQAYDIITKSEPSHLHDDVLGVVNHLEQLATLLVLEAKAREEPPGSETSPKPCLEHLLSENLFDKLYEWAVLTGKYENAVELEQLKLYGILISHYGTKILAAEPFLRPLLKLLSGFRNEMSLPNLESQLVTVLNQLCVALMQNMSFIDLFFLTNHTNNGSHAEFIIVRLLLSSVHLEGATGAAARDALLLCAKMSARCMPLARYMLQGNTCPVLATASFKLKGATGAVAREVLLLCAKMTACSTELAISIMEGNMCPVLATGLSGLYSLLPGTLPEKTSRFSPDDVNQVEKLTLFIDSLEFCNAVAQVAHPSIKKYLLDLLYQGFLVPVMGPALLQTKADALQSGANEQAAAMAYLELMLRCVSERGLLRSVLHFLFIYEYDGVKVVDVLLRRLKGDSQLSLVSLALMETLVNLNCEDVMIELVYKYLLPGHHIVSHHNITNPQAYRDAAAAFLSLSPDCCSRPLSKTRQWVEEMAMTGRKVLEFRESERRGDDIAMGNLAVDAGLNYGNPNETLFGNYHAYLCDARFEIVSRTIACANWTSKYDSVVKRETNNNKETREIEQNHTKEQDSLISICTSEYGTLKTSDTSEKEPHSLTSLNDEKECEVNSDVKHVDSEVKEHDSLISIGDSSDDESFYKDYDSDMYAEEMFRKRLGKVEEPMEYEEVSTVRTWKRNAETLIGPLLSSMLKKADAFLQSEVTVNSRVTSVICKLVSLPTPLLTSLLTTTCVQHVPSLYQILSKLKDEVNDLTDEIDNWHELVDKARVFLMQREAALVTARAPNNDDCSMHGNNAPVNELRRAEPVKRNKFAIWANRLSLSPSSTSNPISSPTAQKRPIFTQESYWNQSVTHRTILNAVLLDEWLKELAALCEEHALKLSADYYEDDSYIKTVAL